MTTETKTKKQASYVAYMPNEDDRPWDRVGVCFENKDGSHTLLVNFDVKKGERLVLRKPRSNEEKVA